MPLSVHRFGDFELDASRFELRRNGRVLKLERIPMELLLLLIEKEGSIATRQEIIERLWGKDVFVDTEHGINTAVRKIRQALRDDPEQPRFVQTVTGKGYRFVGEKKFTEPASNRAENAAEAQSMWGQPRRLSGGADPSRHEPDLHPSANGRTKSWTIAALLLVTLAATLLAANPGGIRDRLFKSKTPSQIRSIGVLPLSNLSGDSSQDYFAGGMTDEVITMLAKNTPLRVISRTSAMRYKGVNRPVTEIAKELGVDGILEGSISRSANRIHMTVQLIDARTDTHIWAESYDRDVDQASALPSELSQTIARQVKIATSLPAQPRFINPEAHDAFLHGRYFWFNGDDRRSQEFFEKAIQLQPDYAAAWAGLSDSYALRAVDSEAPAKDVMAQADSAAHKAVELDDSLPEAHHSLAAWSLFFAWDLPRADAESRRSIELSPNLAEQHHLHSYILFAMNHNDEAMQEQLRATELDPFERTWGLGHAYLQLRNFDAALIELRLRADAMPHEPWIHSLLSDAYRYKGMWKESEQEWEEQLRLYGAPEKAAAIHKAFEQGGEKAVAQWSINDLSARAKKGYVSPLVFAHTYAQAGDRANTLKYLEQCYREHHPWLILIQTEPDFDFVHSEPRYQAVIQKVGLPHLN